jgi:hypothetical protein
MRKYLMLTMALGALLAVSVAGIASAGNKEKVVIGNLEVKTGGGFSPKALPKKTLAPITLTAEGKISTTDGTHPPALKEVVLLTDKNGAVNVTGYPVCKSSQLQSQDSSHAKAICKSALIGSGTTSVAIAFPESKDIIAHSQLLVFNGGVKGGVTTLYIHAYLTLPVPAAIVTTVKIKKIHKGRYGTESVASIPVIAGEGAVTDFSLKVGKQYTYKGKKMSILSAKCPDGKLQAEATAKFRNGLTAKTEFLRPCTPKG